ncbi:hypothetical protein GPOL_174p01540 (plasmid) [Gordonia polyisoprenivorans VH2]|uniref:Restriction endonuclease type IV Mrr domain-containing protein n=1 Tax=Gordonia polyisoprenivorans (strain DSM 44266 / VH2) TaxID=1112204 RepID=H6N5C8_GORPV|nr:hypothetical protein [Gordonia polyisoprenivorans]AFA76173.1 hypothetical protein GPOL_174p01540 [Gordonia polyisoprenivorans VH2]
MTSEPDPDDDRRREETLQREVAKVTVEVRTNWQDWLVDILPSMPNSATKGAASEASLSTQVKPLPWASRLSAMPYLPGGGSKQIEILRELLQATIDNDGLLTATVLDGNGVERSLRDALKPLSSAGFVQPVDRDHVSVTEEGADWLHSQDDSKLLATFHRHVRYVGELLAVLEPGRHQVRDLMEVAGNQYDLAWTTLDQTRRRITWLSCLGAVEYCTSTHVTITQHGRELLSTLVLDGPHQPQARTAEPLEVDDPPPPIAALLAGVSQAQLAGRNPVLGYIPRGNGEADVVQALEALVNAASPSTTKADLLAFAETHFGVSESSFSAVLTTLTRSGLIEQTSLNVYEPTLPGRAWLESGSALDLALLIHARYLFVLEIIPMLQEQDRAPGLARAAVDYYGMKRADTGGMRTRLQILKAAGLIEERANWRYQPTALGEEVAARYSLQTARDHIEPELEASSDARYTPSAVSAGERIGLELVSASTDADNPIRLEQAVVAALQFLGFNSQHVGGGGKTDVLATVDNSDLKPIRVIVDAKSARSGTVSEGAVSFDTLREHQEQHRADHVALVGPSFDGGRIRARASQNQVGLVTTGEMAAAVARHARTPLSAFHFVGLISGNQENRRELEARWSVTEQRTTLLAQVVTILSDEARDTDEVTHGALTSDQIYLIAREGGTGPRPKPRDIESVLELLQHPLVDSVRTLQNDRGRPPSYRLLDSPALVQAKLTALAQALEGVDEALESAD